MKTQKQFILDTLLPYKQDPTTCAMELRSCKYLTEDGRKCAVGKHMKKGKWQTGLMAVSGISQHFGLKKVLKKSALKQGLTIKQWGHIQSYHDSIARDYSDESINEAVSDIEESLNIDLTELKF